MHVLHNQKNHQNDQMDKIITVTAILCSKSLLNSIYDLIYCLFFLQAYLKCSNEKEAIRLLENIVVSNKTVLQGSVAPARVL